MQFWIYLFGMLFNSVQLTCHVMHYLEYCSGLLNVINGTVMKYLVLFSYANACLGMCLNGEGYLFLY